MMIEGVKGIISGEVGKTLEKVYTPSREGRKVDVPPVKDRDRAVESPERSAELDKAVEEAVSRLRNALGHKVKLEIDAELKIVKVRILDSETGELIRQVPFEEIIAISKRLKEMQGILFDKEV